MHTREAELLLTCISARPGPRARRSAAETLERGVDWDRVLSAAELNGVAPFFRRRLLLMAPQGAVPQDAQDRLDRASRFAGLRNTLFCQEAGAILRALSDAGVGAVALKGAALAETLWKDVCPRPMQDVDLLVDDERLAHRVLTDLGYRPMEQAWQRPGHHHLAPYVHPDRAAVVEIHRGLVLVSEAFSVDVEGARARSRPIDVGGAPARALCPEDTLTHLCLHLACHDFIGGARYLLDVTQAVEQWGAGMDWSFVVGQAIGRGYAAFLYYPLELARRALHARPPAEMLARLRAAVQLSGVADRLLRTLASRTVLARPTETMFLPDWVAGRICRAAIRGRAITAELAGLPRAVAARLTEGDGAPERARPRGWGFALGAVRGGAAAAARLAGMLPGQR